MSHMQVVHIHLRQDSQVALESIDVLADIPHSHLEERIVTLLRRLQVSNINSVINS